MRAAGAFSGVWSGSMAQRILISGKVQRVGFRDWAVRTAHSLGVIGWVRNLNDGRVEMLADGDEEAIGALVDACREGPPLADVVHVEAIAAGEHKQVKGFTKRFTA